MKRHLNQETSAEADEPEQMLDASEAHMPASLAR
jgi:aerobic C4-dicarboxylate transport protein